MVDRTALSPEALAWFDGLSQADQLALVKSNDDLQSLKAMRDYHARMAARADEVLYQRLPEPSIPSNQLLDELDSE